MANDAASTVTWRPSWWVVGAHLVFGVFGGIGLVASALPRDLAIPGACVALLAGALRALRERRRPARTLRIAELDLHWRGPLAFDTRHGLSWWPDTLAARGRRAMRLAASRQE
ncbi:hypothetical protein LYSHEL_25260 [Lysobacter helvus]|uniref:PH domain-containing protein n=2 Tax=Lysobacteraceae TaxID=32033 RepID=A0ABM7Q899_9GAMM|nr:MULTISPECIES: hypothetical protein [Lysobacter]BCT93502.1 hypothetical protein LYSCAS_25260 [Lysobacter caseinilyticus]BCT96655.1 hypothetical protein LYSHEL_25260 [Lysobacter helvus]